MYFLERIQSQAPGNEPLVLEELEFHDADNIMDVAYCGYHITFTMKNGTVFSRSFTMREDSMGIIKGTYEQCVMPEGESIVKVTGDRSRRIYLTANGGCYLHRYVDPVKIPSLKDRVVTSTFTFDDLTIVQDTKGICFLEIGSRLLPTRVDPANPTRVKICPAIDIPAFNSVSLISAVKTNAFIYLETSDGMVHRSKNICDYAFEAMPFFQHNPIRVTDVSTRIRSAENTV